MTRKRNQPFIEQKQILAKFETKIYNFSKHFFALDF